MARYTIIGAGPVGTLMGLMLARRGQRVCLIERRADPRAAAPEGGRSINLALAARGIAALEYAGMSASVAAHMIPMPGRMLHDEHAALQFMPYGQEQHEVIYAIGRERLNRILIEAAAAHPGIELRFNLRCTDVDPAAGSLQLRDAGGATRSEAFEILLGADGAGSAVRAALQTRSLAQVDEQPLAHDYKELHIPARDGGYALDPDALHVWPRHGFMLIALPNPDRTFTATLFLPHTGAPGFNSLRSDGEVQQFFDREFATAAALIPDLPAQFREHPQGHLGTIHADPWACGPVLLLGDAAHAIVPFHGQGMNAAFEDCSVLDALLDASPAAHDWPALFAKFDRARRQDAEAIARMALENYAEMRSSVLDERFLRQKAWALQLERLYPERFIPRYAMVMFHPEISYSEALRRGAVQQQVLDVLDALRRQGSLSDSSPLSDGELKRAQELIAERL
jgi:kynurenine 3-monooxygenase